MRGELSGRYCRAGYKHGMVKIFDKDLKFKSSFGGPGKNPGALNMPQGMDLDEAGNIWVA